MSEVSPPKPTSPEKERDTEDGPTPGRTLALGGLRRVYKSRQKVKERKPVVSRRTRGDDEGSDAESDEEDYPVTQNTSNHYTLNMPGPAPQQSDLPYILLGYVVVF